jgi:hypothetical protein
MNKISYILTLLMLIPSFLYGFSMVDPDIQKTVTISGHITDAETGERLPIERCYRSKPVESDEERLEYLFKLHEKRSYNNGHSKRSNYFIRP